MKETRQGLIRYLEIIAEKVEMHPQAKEAVLQAASVICGITDEEFKRIEDLQEVARDE